VPVDDEQDEQGPSALVRLEVQYTGALRSGMFVQVTFHSQHSVIRAEVPRSAIVHLVDGDWVYVPVDGGRFKRVQVISTRTLPHRGEEVTGIDPGQRIVENARALQDVAEEATQ
ncbi:MAG TPA: efflux RND transporter periplasmic adaptor subunit, partial [Blastocatellia bacterium]